MPYYEVIYPNILAESHMRKPITLPDRPISHPDQDWLERAGFVSRFLSAIIDRKKNVATGVVVGITGPWGSGKSSLLNLIEYQIKKEYPRSIVFKFDPWLVSTRDDLVSRFFVELKSVICSRSSERREWSDIAVALSEYVEALSPVVEKANGIAGASLKFAGWFLKRRAISSGTIHEKREHLRAMLGTVRVPIVILIDELDRVDDDEVRVVAQLVRAVFDFPRVSYVISYDHERVAEALGVSRA